MSISPHVLIAADAYIRKTIPITTMALPTVNNKDGKKGNKNKNNNVQANKFGDKPGKAANFSKKPPKTGGTRGS